MGHALDQAPPLEGVQHRRHAAGGDDEPLGHHAGLERLACPLDHGQRLFASGRQPEVGQRLTVVQTEQQAAGPHDVGVALGRRPVGTGVLLFEVGADPDGRCRLVGSVQCDASS